MGASNINAVTLHPTVRGAVTISGKVTTKTGCHVSLLHVWLAQPGNPGAGLAIDYLADKPKGSFAGGPFVIDTSTLAPGNTGVVGDFVGGPATVSVIAVLSDTTGAVQEVLEWSLIVVLAKGRVRAGATTKAPGKSP